MRDYEILFIVRPELDDEQVAAAAAQVSTLITNLGGKPAVPNLWGKRRLAYEVKHLREGYYVLTDFELDPSRVPELEGSLKISDTVFRHLVVLKEKATPAKAPVVTEAVAEAAVEVEPVVNVAAEAAVEPDAIVAPEPVEAIVEPEPVVAAVVSPSEPEGTPEEVGKEA